VISLGPLDEVDLLALQRTAGNEAVTRMLLLQREPAPAAPAVKPVSESHPLSEFAKMNDQTATGYLNKLGAAEDKAGLAVLVPGVRTMTLAINMEAGFGAGLAIGLANWFEPKDFSAFNEGMRDPANNLAFQGGATVGFGVGAVEDLVTNLVGLWDLAKLAYALSLPGMMQAMTEEIIAYAKDPAGRRDYYRKLATRAKEAAVGLEEFAQYLNTNPHALIQEGRDLGYLAGDLAGKYYYANVIAEKSYYWKGYAVGRIEGMIAMEIALLFCGEEILNAAAKGATSIARGAALTLKESAFGLKVLEMMDKVPGLSRIVKAIRAVEEAEAVAAEGAKVERKLLELIPEKEPSAPMSSVGDEGRLARQSGQSGGGVFRRHVSGVDHEVAVKVIPSNDPAIAHFENELEGAEAAARTGFGPKVHGEVKVEGGRAFAMDIQPGGFTGTVGEKASQAEELAAKGWAQEVNGRTLEEMAQYRDALWKQGHYYRGEVQVFVDKGGAVKPIDFGGIRRVPPPPPAGADAAAVERYQQELADAWKTHNDRFDMESRLFVKQAGENGQPASWASMAGAPPPAFLPEVGAGAAAPGSSGPSAGSVAGKTAVGAAGYSDRNR
jgi:hypothetical protein